MFWNLVNPGYGPIALNEGVGGLLPQSVELFERMTATGVSPSAARQTNINTLIRSLVTSTVWDELDYLHVRSAETEAHALLNWKGDYINASKVGSPVFTENEGFVCSAGSGNYISTGFNPGGAGTFKYLQNDAHFGIWSRTNVDENQFDIGERVGASQNANIRLRTANAIIANVNQDTTPMQPANTNSLGHYVARRSGAGATALFKDGVSIATGTAASSTIPNLVWFEGTVNQGGAPVTASTRQYACSHAGGSLSDAQIAALYSALDTFFDAILAEVI